MKIGFNILKDVVQRLSEKYDNLYWMTLSEISRYWAAKNLTRIDMVDKKVRFAAPFGVKEFTVKLDKKIRGAEFTSAGEKKVLEKRNNRLEINAWTHFIDKNESILCFNLPKGESEIVLN